MAAWEATEGPDSEPVANSLMNLGRNHVRRGYPDQAIEPFRRALAIRVKLFGEDAEQTEEARHELAQLEAEKR